MSLFQLRHFARRIIQGKLTLAMFRNTYGYELAVIVNEEMKQAVFQPVRWVRRIR